MTDILWFALRLNLLVACMVIFYLAMLRRLTFYMGNRVYFLGAMMISLLLACVSISFMPPIAPADLPEALGNMARMAGAQIKDAYHGDSPGLNRVMIIGSVIYFAGVSVMLLRLVLAYYKTVRTIKRAKPAELPGSRVFVLGDDSPPFSFMNRIYLNPQLYTDDQLQDILIHEKFHIRQWHLMDLHFVELILCLCWFNPLAWTFKRHLAQNLEYATDEAVIRKNGRPCESYQLNLVNIAAGRSLGWPSSQFGAASLKNRLFRMNMTRSSAGWQRAIYFLILPLIAGLNMALHMHDQKSLRGKIEVQQLGQPTALLVDSRSLKTGSQISTMTHSKASPHSKKLQNTSQGQSRKESVRYAYFFHETMRKETKMSVQEKSN